MKRFLSIFHQKERDKSELRSKEKKQHPVEQLEQRLCLGSMHAGIAGWGQPLTNSEATEVRLTQDGSIDDVTSANPASEVEYEDQANETHQADQSKRPISFEYDASRQQPVPRGGIDSLNRGYESLISTALVASDSVDSSLHSRTNSIVQPIPLPVPDAPQPAHRSLTQATAKSNVVSDDQQFPTDEQARPNVNDVNFKHQAPPPVKWDSSLLASIGLETDQQGNAIGLSNSEIAKGSGYEAWWANADEPVVIKYDFRDVDGQANQISETQKQLAAKSLEAWSKATDRKIVFELDTEASENRIINIGVGDLSVGGHVSGEGAVLGLGGGQVTVDGNDLVANGLAWLDKAEKWDNVLGNGNPENSIDFSTVVAHEIGHTIGLGDQYGTQNNAMDGNYTGERGLDSIQIAIDDGYFYRTVVSADMASAIELQPMTTGFPQLEEADVKQLLKRAAAASASEDAIIAVVDRNGRILGVRVEKDVLTAIPDMETLVFAIDGAVAKARTAAMFSNGDPANGTLAPLTSRTVQFLSQSTITQREVESNPNVDRGSKAEALASTERGPGFVAAVGVGGHFPPEINFTPLVDLFGIEHTNRDSTLHPGADGIKGTADDISFAERFNIDPAFIPAGQNLAAPESFGTLQNSGKLLDAQSRGIATLPGGIPLFRDSDGVGGGETLIGGIGVFFPGTDGYATHEQGFIPGIGQTTTERVNASRVLESEYIAYAAAGGSQTAENQGLAGAKIGAINGVAAVPDLDLPFGRLDLVGIQLDVFGPMGGQLGLEMLLDVGNTLGVGDPNSGADQVVDGIANELYRDGETVPEGWLVTPHDSADGSITAAEVTKIIENGITGAEHVRAAVRLPLSNATRMVLAVTDTNGEVLGMFRMQDATTFSIDVAVAKARNVAYFADANDLQEIDRLGEAGTAYTNRTFRFLSQPRFPSGIDGTVPAPYSILFDGDMDPLTGENLGAPAPVSAFTDTKRAYGFDSFFPNTNFRDPGDGVNPEGSPDAYHLGHDTIANQNGVVFFPGSTPLYKDGKLIGGFGVSGDGVDQDDVVTYVGATGFLPEGHGVTRADQTFVRGIRLPYQKFLRNPFGGLC